MTELQNTPFFQEHRKLGAKMGPFAGWNMPIQYPGGIINERNHCREKASLFDTSHMGEFVFKGNIAASGLDNALTFAPSALTSGRCRYGLLLNEQGGILDDLIVYRINENELFIVVNAGTIQRDLEAIRATMKHPADLQNISDNTAKLDLQGPLSGEIMAENFGEEIKNLRYFHHRPLEIFGEKALVSRTGYTGERGYEFYAGAETLLKLWNKFLSDERIKPAGLGARDILRLEMGYPLYGNDMDETTDPFDSGLEMFTDFNHDFQGKKALLEKQKNGFNLTRVGFRTESRRSARSHQKVFADNREIGVVTSGSFSPLFNTGIGMLRINKNYAKTGTVIEIEAAKALKATVSELPFYKEETARK